MKQLSIVLAAGFFTLIVILAYQVRHNPKPKPDCYECKIDRFTSLSAADFEDGIHRYKQLRSDVIDGSVLKGIKPDARNCWYSLDTLKTFICLIEKYAKKRGIPSERLGIRFHYAVYPDIKPDYPTYARLHTLYLSATVHRSGFNQDFDPRYLDEVLGKKHIPSDSLLLRSYIYNIYMSDPGAKLLVLPLPYENPVQPPRSAGSALTGATPVMSRNQGQLCPNYPNCPPSK